MLLSSSVDNRHVAVVDPTSGERWTYQRLVEEIALVRKELPQLQRGRLLFLPFRTALPCVLLYLAALDARCTVALLDPQQNEAHRGRLEMAYLPDLIAGSPPTNAGAFQTLSALPHLPAIWSSTEARPLPQDAAILLPTSGSTGSPKMVRLSFDALRANAAGIVGRLAIDQDEVAIANLPLHYSYGLSILNSHLLASATIVLSPASAMQSEFWSLMNEYRVTSLAGVPYSYEMYRRTGLLDRPLPCLRTLTQAGGRLAPERILEFNEWIMTRGGAMYVMYGQTEATARMSVLDPTDLPDNVGSVGTPLAGGDFEVRNPDSEGVGEVVYRGPNVMLGYAEERGDLFAGNVLGGVLNTGDIGHLDTVGRLWLVGRSKRIAKLFGQRVSLDDVEMLLLKEGPTAAVEEGNKVVLFCQWGDPVKFLAVGRSLARELRTNPRAFEFRRVDVIPRSANDKVAYAELKSRL